MTSSVARASRALTATAAALIAFLLIDVRAQSLSSSSQAARPSSSSSSRVRNDTHRAKISGDCARVCRFQRSSFTRYVEYAETPFARPSYFSVPYRMASSQKLEYISNEMFAHLIREHVRHQQRLRANVEQQAQAAVVAASSQPPTTPLPLLAADGKQPILSGVSRLTELRQTQFRRFSHNSTFISYEEKRRRWKEDVKQRLRGQKVPPRQVGAAAASASTDAGRYFITYNPITNAYQVSRRLPAYARNQQQQQQQQQRGESEMYGECRFFSVHSLCF